MLMMSTQTCWRGLLLIAYSIDSGDLEIISMHKEGDGAQKLELFKHPEEKVCQNSCLTFSWLNVSTLPSRSTWMLMETDCLQVMQMDQSVFNWLSYV